LKKEGPPLRKKRDQTGGKGEEKRGWCFSENDLFGQFQNLLQALLGERGKNGMGRLAKKKKKKDYALILVYVNRAGGKEKNARKTI